MSYRQIGCVLTRENIHNYHPYVLLKTWWVCHPLEDAYPLLEETVPTALRTDLQTAVSYNQKFYTFICRDRSKRHPHSEYEYVQTEDGWDYGMLEIPTHDEVTYPDNVIQYLTTVTDCVSFPCKYRKGKTYMRDIPKYFINEANPPHTLQVAMDELRERKKAKPTVGTAVYWEKKKRKRILLGTLLHVLLWGSVCTAYRYEAITHNDEWFLLCIPAILYVAGKLDAGILGIYAVFLLLHEIL